MRVYLHLVADDVGIASVFAIFKLFILRIPVQALHVPAWKSRTLITKPWLFPRSPWSIHISIADCAGEGCIPPMKFMWGRQDCDNERNIFRIFPGTDADGRQFIRQNFRMNLQEVVAILGE